MIVVDSSGWVEWFAGGALAGEYAPYLKDFRKIVTPTIVLYEVYKRIKRDLGEEQALLAVASMQQTVVFPLTDEVALSAADLSLQHRLAMADAIVLATAHHFRAQLVTSDSDFEAIEGVIVHAKRK